MQCPRCGQDNPQEHTFCSACGAPQRSGRERPQRVAAARVRRKAEQLAPEERKQRGLLLTLAPGVELELVRVPAGSFTMGEGKNEHTIPVNGFLIGKYPVTVAQYRAFVRATGYRPERNALRGKSDHPVRRVSWDDAMAFCQWAGEATRGDVHLPTEAEWEKAARGRDGRRYPWGNERPTRDRCNCGLGPLTTTPVGRYSPQGDSSYGCADMAGNVWEWTSSLYKAYPYDAEDGREDPDSRGMRVVRGGSFGSFARYVRSAYRNLNVPTSGYSVVGFRVSASAI